MKKYNPKKIRIVFFIFIIILAVFLRFWGIPGSDLQHDTAINSVRAYGWFDYLTGQGQTSPVVWFSEIPWWANLSFHDHPPLTFFIQNIFFKVVGASTFSALLPFILAGIGVVFLIYFFLKNIELKKEALLASFLFAISAHSVWVSRSGYLEGIEIFFIFLGFICFIYFLYFDKKRYLFFWAASFSLAILSKYTAVFMFPAAILYLLIWRRDVFKMKEFWLSLVFIFLILSPLIFYNLMVFQTRGHFDAALSSMLAMHPADFEVISQRGTNTDFLSNISSTFKSIGGVSSTPFFILNILSLFYLLAKVIRKKGNLLINFLFINILMIVLMFCFGSGAVRFLSIIFPFLSISLSLMICELWQQIKIYGRFYLKILSVFLIFLFCFEVFYSVNTNILKKPIGKKGFFYSSGRFYQSGFNELEQYLKDNVFKNITEKRKIKNFSQISSYYIKGKEVVLFDERIDWFSRMWHIDRYIIYYNAPVFYFTDLDIIFSSSNIEKNFIDYLRQDLEVAGFWFVVGANEGVNRKNQYYNELVESLEDQLILAGINPESEIKNYLGNVVFRVYRFQ